ncbi:MAG: tetratricopeptide repeat protein [Bacteroidetes bacterium]|nr:tetratricopeptide repeat protein [Bacteroidota bacterium]
MLGFHGFTQTDSIRMQSLMTQANNAIDNGDYTLAEQKTDSLYKASQYSGNKFWLAESHNLKGIIYRDQSNLKDALDNYIDALKLFEELKLTRRIPGIHNNIGQIYAEIGEYKTALSYYFKAEKINKNLNNLSSLAINYNNIATCYQKLQQYVSAEVYLKKSLALRQQENDSLGLAMSYHNLGLNYQLTQRQDSAIRLFHKSLDYLKTYNENMGHAYNYLELGNSLLIQKKYAEAEKYLVKSLAVCTKNNFDGVRIEVYKHLYELYFALHDYKQAFEYQNAYLAAKESLEGDENKNEILKKELEYEFARKQELQRIETANREAIAAAEMKSQKRLTSYAIMALIILSGLILLVFRSYTQKRRANFIITRQKEIVEHKNKEILDSINYAKYIQNALLPTEAVLRETNLRYFVMYKPKDIVSGDFYWVQNLLSAPLNDDKHGAVLIAVADCTGHGVPGALVSVVGNNGLNSCIREYNITDPAKILDKLSVLVQDTFDKSENELKDGMDISLCAYYPHNNTLQWAGANNPLWIVRNKQLIEIKADKQPVGTFIAPHPFHQHEIQVLPGDRIYLFTDGFADQFGGPKGKKFKYKQLEELLIASSTSPVTQQQAILHEAFMAWKGDKEQVDDVCIFGFEIA